MRLKPQTYVLTSVTFERRRIFQHPPHAELMISVLCRHRDLQRLLIHGFAIRKLHRGDVWQDGCRAHRIVDADDYRNQLHYIAQNSIRKRRFDYPDVHTRGTWPLDESPAYPGG